MVKVKMGRIICDDHTLLTLTCFTILILATLTLIYASIRFGIVRYQIRKISNNRNDRYYYKKTQ